MESKAINDKDLEKNDIQGEEVSGQERMQNLMQTLSNLKLSELENYKIKIIDEWVADYNLPETEVEKFIAVDLIMQKKLSQPKPKEGVIYGSDGKKVILPSDHNKPKPFKN